MPDFVLSLSPVLNMYVNIFIHVFNMYNFSACSIICIEMFLKQKVSIWGFFECYMAKPFLNWSLFEM